MAAYETTVCLGPFKGLYQESGAENLSLSYAADAYNCDTQGGGLKPMKAGTEAASALPSPIGTLMRLHRRFYGEAEKRELLCAAAGKRLYVKTPDENGWTEIQGIALQSDSFDYVTYEVNRQGDAAPVDVLLMSNPKDGMLCLYGDDLHVGGVYTPHKFGVIARHAERIWGGGIESEPDKLMYSAPFNPFDWEQNNEIPEDGAGEVLQPSWDGDSFMALRPYGSQLLAFKHNRIWRILGTDPGSYIMKEQYGGGALIENTIAVDGDRVFMLSYQGLMHYDGVGAYPFQTRQVQHVWARVNQDALNKACAVIFNEKCYIALPLDQSVVNNSLLEYDMNDKTFMLRMGVSVKAFLAVNDMLYFSSDQTPGRLFKLSGGEALPLRWVSGWQDLNAKNVNKSGFALYVSAYSQSDFSLTFTVETEKKRKTKTVPIKAGEEKVKRINIGGGGRRYRFIIEAPAVDFQLLGGIQVSIELDAD